MNRWHQLNERERHLVRLYVVEKKKLSTVAHEMGISVTRTTQFMTVIFRIMEVADKSELALWVGRNWDLVNEKPKIAKVS